MKKINRLLLAIGLMLCFTVSAFAAEPELTEQEKASIEEAQTMLEEMGISAQPDPGEPIERSLNAYYEEPFENGFDGFYDPENDRDCEQWYAGLYGAATLGLYSGKDLAAERPADGMLWGIDVSHHQGKINWDAAQEGMDFAILRCGYGNDLPEQDDTQWYNNANACKRLGIPFGTYIYSYATNTSMAKSEANHVLRLVKNYDLSFPIYFDMEDAKMAKLSNAELAAIAKTFCDTVSAKGYKVGIYASRNWWQTKLTDNAFKNSSWDRWIAHWSVDMDYSAGYDVWQYGGCYVKGIANPVDGNVYYAGRYPHKSGTETLGDLLSLARIVKKGAKSTPTQLTKYDLNGDARLTEDDMKLLVAALMK